MRNLHNSDSESLIDAIHAHLDNFIDEDEIIVFHETETDIVHTDIFWIKPNFEYRPYSILLTCGLSFEPMKVPDETYDKFAEVAMLLPKEWELENGAWKEEINGWPINHLRTIAKIPYTNESWIGYGHTITYDTNKLKSFPGTQFNSSVLLSSFTLPEKFTRIAHGDRTIRVYSSIPLYPEELNFKLKNDANTLVDKFIQFEIEEILNPARINTCK